MATKPKANPMRKPKTPSTRTPITRGQDRDASIRAKNKTMIEALQAAEENRSVPNQVLKIYRNNRKKDQIILESARIKKAGERMARAQAASKAKRSK